MPTVDEMVASAKRSRSSTKNGRKARAKLEWADNSPRYPELNANTGALRLECTYRPPTKKGTPE